jgi:hypothetical protein
MASEGQNGHLHETRDANVKSVLKFGIGLAVLILVTCIVMAWFFGFLGEVQKLGPPASPFAESQTQPPAPRLQVQPVQDLSHLRQDEDEKLNSYGWVDQKAGIARIPIDRAMDLLLQKGLPVQQEQQKGGMKK